MRKRVKKHLKTVVVKANKKRHLIRWFVIISAFGVMEILETSGVLPHAATTISTILLWEVGAFPLGHYMEPLLAFIIGE